MINRLQIVVPDTLYWPLRLCFALLLMLFSFYTYEVYERGYLYLNGELVSRDDSSLRFYSRLFIEKGVGLSLLAWIALVGIKKAHK